MSENASQTIDKIKLRMVAADDKVKTLVCSNGYKSSLDLTARANKPWSQLTKYLEPKWSAIPHIHSRLLIHYTDSAEISHTKSLQEIGDSAILHISPKLSSGNDNIPVLSFKYSFVEEGEKSSSQDSNCVQATSNISNTNSKATIGTSNSNFINTNNNSKSGNATKSSHASKTARQVDSQDHQQNENQKLETRQNQPAQLADYNTWSSGQHDGYASNQDGPDNHSAYTPNDNQKNESSPYYYNMANENHVYPNSMPMGKYPGSMHIQRGVHGPSMQSPMHSHMHGYGDGYMSYQQMYGMNGMSHNMSPQYQQRAMTGYPGVHHGYPPAMYGHGAMRGYPYNMHGYPVMPHGGYQYYSNPTEVTSKKKINDTKGNKLQAQSQQGTRKQSKQIKDEPNDHQQEPHHDAIGNDIQLDAADNHHDHDDNENNGNYIHNPPAIEASNDSYFGYQVEHSSLNFSRFNEMSNLKVESRAAIEKRPGDNTSSVARVDASEGLTNIDLNGEESVLQLLLSVNANTMTNFGNRSNISSDIFKSPMIPKVKDTSLQFRSDLGFMSPIIADSDSLKQVLFVNDRKQNLESYKLEGMNHNSDDVSDVVDQHHAVDVVQSVPTVKPEVMSANSNTNKSVSCSNASKAVLGSDDNGQQVGIFRHIENIRIQSPKLASTNSSPIPVAQATDGLLPIISTGSQHGNENSRTSIISNGSATKSKSSLAELCPNFVSQNKPEMIPLSNSPKKREYSEMLTENLVEKSPNSVVEFIDNAVKVPKSELNLIACAMHDTLQRVGHDIKTPTPIKATTPLSVTTTVPPQGSPKKPPFLPQHSIAKAITVRKYKPHLRRITPTHISMKKPE